MRMKFNKSGQLLLVAAASLLGATVLTACATLTVDFVFVASSKAAGTINAGEINVMEINSESGAMRQIPTSPFPSGGRNPVAEAVSSDNSNLYVVNQDDNSIVQFIIGNDGKLYPQNTTNTAGIYPFAVSVSGTTLFVADLYQPLPTCSTAAPCSGSIAVYPITVGTTSPPSDSIGPNPVANGNLTYWPLSIPGSPNDVVEPTGINVLHSGSYLYVSAYDSTAASNFTAGANYVFGFAIASSGALTPLNGGAPLVGGAIDTGTCTNAYLNAPFISGTCAAAIASDPSSSYVYVTDSVNNEVHAYSVAAGTGLLTSLGSPVNSGNQPSAIVVDPAYSYVYVANALDSTVTAYSMSEGALTNLGTYTTGSEPVAIGIDPSTNHFLFTANYLGSGISGNVSGFELSPTAGTLLTSKSSPYNSNALPTAVAAIPHGSSGSSTTK